MRILMKSREKATLVIEATHIYLDTDDEKTLTVENAELFGYIRLKTNDQICKARLLAKHILEQGYADATGLGTAEFATKEMLDMMEEEGDMDYDYPESDDDPPENGYSGPWLIR